MQSYKNRFLEVESLASQQINALQDEIRSLRNELDLKNRRLQDLETDPSRIQRAIQQMSQQHGSNLGSLVQVWTLI